MTEIYEKTIENLKGKTIALAIPGDQGTNKFFLSLVDLIAFFKDHDINYFISNERRADMTNCRNRVLLYGQPGKKGAVPFNGKHYDYVLWIDTDMIFQPMHFLSLVSRDREIISGCYAQTPSKMVAGYIMDTGLGFLSNTSVRKGGELEVDFFGLGFTLIKRGVFENISYPWFYPRMTTFKEKGAWTHTGEDVSLCRKLKEQFSYDLYLDLDVRLGHQKNVIMSLEEAISPEEG